MTGPPTPSSDAISALAPTGTLRAAINLSNFLLVTGADNGAPVGVSPDMAHALAQALGVPIELHTYPSPGELADAATDGVWDVGNIGAEPQRAENIAFTPPYCEIEATYLVPAGSPVASIEDVDRPGIQIAVKERAAYTLWLERNLEHAELVQTASHDDTLAAFLDRNLDVLAGLRPRLMTDLESVPGGQVLAARFATVQQAVGTPRDRDPAGIDYLTRFVEHAKGSGIVASLIDRHGVTGRLVPAR